MKALFIEILNMSITASILILLILILRLFLKKAPKWLSILLWSFVAIRLICPVGIESSFSLIPKTDWISVTESVTPSFDSIPQDYIVNIDPSIFDDSIVYTTEVQEPQIEIHRGRSTTDILAYVWVSGMAVMVIYMLYSCIRIYGKTDGAKHFDKNVYLSEEVETPFVFGLLRPRIFLPENIDAVNMSYVISHEKAHIRRLDHLWKPLGFLLLTVHWFNPLMWIAYVLLCRDIEMACDERVVKEYNDNQKADYSEALLTCSVKRSMVTACPLAFGEVGVKTRIKSVLNYKKPAFWIVLVALLLCVATALFFLTDPVIPETPPVEPDKITETPPEDDLSFDPHWAGDEYTMPFPKPPYSIEFSFRDNMFMINTASMDDGLAGSLSDIIEYCERLKNIGYNLGVAESETDGISEDRKGYYFTAENYDGLFIELKYDGAGYMLFASTPEKVEPLEPENTDVNPEASDSEENVSDEAEVSAAEVAISLAIREHFRDTEPTGLLNTSSFVILGSDIICGTPLYGQTESVQKETYYILVLHRKYNMSDTSGGVFEEYFSPAVVKFTVKGGSYTLDDYWEPENGADSDAEIKAKFPQELHEDLKNAKAHLADLIKECDEQRKSYLSNLGRE